MAIVATIMVAGAWAGVLGILVVILVVVVFGGPHFGY